MSDRAVVCPRCARLAAAPVATCAHCGHAMATSAESQVAPDSSTRVAPVGAFPVRPRAAELRGMPDEAAEGLRRLRGFLLILTPVAVTITGWLGDKRDALAVGLALVAMASVATAWRSLRQASLARTEQRRQRGLSADELAIEEREVTEYRSAVQAHMKARLDEVRCNRQAEQERTALDRRDAATEVQRLTGPQREDGAELLTAFGRLTGMRWNERTWLKQSEARIDTAGQMLGPAERVVHVAIAQNSKLVTEGIVVTTLRVGVIKGSRTEWVPRSQVQKATTMPSVRGRHVALETTQGNWQWWEVQPKAASHAIVATLKGQPQRGTSSTDPSVYGHVVLKTTAKYLGGEFIGSQARAASALAPRLSEGDTVKIELTDDDLIVLRRGQSELARYSVRDARLTIDRAATVGRGVRKGRLAATAAASVIFTPVALVGLAASTARRIQDNFALAVDDGADFGLFALSDASVGRRLTAQRRGLTELADEYTSAPPKEDGRAAPDPIAQLERLVALREAGALTDDEFESLKHEILSA